MNEKPETNELKLPPFWLRWLAGFLIFVPANPLSRFLFGAAFGFGLAVLPYILQFVRTSNPQQEQERIAELQRPPALSMHHFYGIISTLTGVTSCASHLVSGYPSVFQVILLTLGVPFYDYLVVCLLTILSKGMERRAEQNKVVVAVAVVPASKKVCINTDTSDATVSRYRA